MAADSSIIIDTRIDTGGFAKGAGNLKTQFADLGSSVKKLGGLVAAAFSVSQIIAFGKEAIELGSDLQEVQNVVDVTFTTMNEQINEFAKNAAKTAGISETMAKRYTGTFGAMAKSFGFTEGEAYKMSTALTQMAGDVASFYNLTQDAAYTKLKSVFTGETESLKDLGVVMTQTALDDFALRKGLKKTTSQMSEQEKVALRYQFVMEQLAGASGDFLRTSDSWANQTRLLSLQFDTLKATIGQGLINALTPAIKVINEMIAKLQVFADSFLAFTQKIFGSAGDTSSALGDMADGASDLAENTEAAGKAAKKALSPFDEIVKIDVGSQKDATPGAEGALIGGADTTIGGDVQDNISPALDSIAQKLRELIGPLMEIDFGPLLSQVKKLGPIFKRLGSAIASNLSWAWENILVPLSEWAIEDLAPASAEYLTSALELLATAAEPVWEGIQKIGEHLKPVFTWIGVTAVDYLNFCKDSFVKLSDKIQEKGSVISGIFDNIGEVLSTLWETAEPILRDLYTEFKDVADLTFETILEELGNLLDQAYLLTDALKAMVKGDWTAAWDSLEKWLESVSKSLQNWAEWYDEMYKKDWFKAIIDAFNDWAMSGGSTNNWYGVPSLAMTGYSLPTSPQIPYLAKGAVIPPNAPFAAVLGDQRHGTNIEAPLSTIQEAVALVMEDHFAGMMTGFEEMVAVLREILEAVYGIQIGDEVIAQAVGRYNRKMNTAKGGA